MGKFFVASMNTDSVTAYDAVTGGELWRFYTCGPVRLAPAVWDGKIYFGSDDAWFYCLDTDTGKLVWKFNSAPTDHRALGNERVISMWPVRGAPVVKDGIVYFASGVWPFLGTFLYALDAETGAMIWANTGHSTEWQAQPHGGAYAFAGISPQGYIAVAEDRIVVSGGRSFPALFDRTDGKVLHTQVRGQKLGGGYRVGIEGSHYFNHGSRYSLRDGSGAGSGRLRNQYYNLLKERTDALADQLDSPVFESIVASGRLYITTVSGRIYCFGAEPVDSPEIFHYQPSAPEPVATDTGKQADLILEKTNIKDGYALVFGAGDGGLLEQLALKSQLKIIAVEPDRDQVDALRRRLDEAGLYGKRVAVIKGDPADIHYPLYISSLLIVADPDIAAVKPDSESMERIYSLLRPYEGKAWVNFESGKQADQAVSSGFVPENGKIHPDGNVVILTREGALPGSGQWTHQYADSAQSVMSGDQLVRAPFGPIWFGGPNHDNILPRHAAGPRPQVAAGRLVILGVETISARCVFTGRELWVREFPGIGHPFTDLELEERWEHGQSVYMVNQPGASYIGSPYVTLPDSIYVRHEKTIFRLDPETGATMDEWHLPVKASDAVQEVSDDDPLEELARSHKIESVRKTALKYIDNQELLKEVAVNDENSHVRIAALSNITCEQTLADIAMSDREASVRLAATARISQPDLLKQIIEKAGHIQVHKIDFDVQIDGDSSKWEQIPGIFLGTEEDVFPADSRKNWTGTNDLSATVRTAWDENNLYIAVTVRDDKHFNAAEPPGVWNGDSLQFAIDSGKHEEPFNLMLALISGEVLTHQSRGPETGVFEKSEYLITRDNDKNKTLYELRIPLECLEIDSGFGSVFSFNAVIFEDDAGEGYEYWLQITPGIAGGWNPDRFNRFVLWEDDPEKTRPAKMPEPPVGDVDRAELARMAMETAPDWGHISVRSDYIVTTTDPHIFRGGSLGTWGDDSWDATSSEQLVVLDRRTGKMLWARNAKTGFRHNAIASSGNTLFVNDILSEQALQMALRRGMDIDDNARLYAFDISSGNVIWTQESEVFGTFLSYSREHDILIEGGSRDGRRTLRDEPTSLLIARQGATGKILWKREGSYNGPVILHSDMIISARPGPAICIHTGENKDRAHPVTGEEAEWSYWKTYGCGTANAGANLLLFRSGAAGFTDIEHDGGTGMLGGFRAGCTASMIPADGVLNAPDYTRTCTCSYQNQTSLGLIHMPEMELWTVNRPILPVRGPIEQIGINIGAPGDRRAENGTLWVPFPENPAAPPQLSVALDTYDFTETPVQIVAISDSGRIVRTENTLDGNYTTHATVRCNRRGSFNQWIAYELNKPVEIDKIEAVWNGPEHTHFQVQTSMDGETWNTVYDNRPPLPELKEILDTSAADELPAEFQLEEPVADTEKDEEDQHVYRFEPVTVSYVRLFFREHGDLSEDSRGRRVQQIAELSSVKICNLPWPDAYSWFMPKKFYRENSLFVDGSQGLNWVAASGIHNLRMLRLDDMECENRVYTVVLHFMEPDDIGAGERVFNIAVQGENKAQMFDIVAEAGAKRKAVKRSFNGIRIDDSLTLEFEMAPDASYPPVLAGIEIKAE